MADAEKIIRINALGTVYVNQEFHKVMDGGVIVDVASNSGYMLPSAMLPRRAYPLALTNEDAFVKRLVRRASLMHNKDVDPQMAYMISKNFARWYAAGCAFKYMRRRGIRVLSVSPGYVETPMTEKEKRQGYRYSALLLRPRTRRQTGRVGLSHREHRRRALRLPHGH